MIFIDTHTHLYDTQFGEDLDQIIKNAIEKGVTRMMLPAVDSETHEKLISLAIRYPDHLFPMIGLHPTSVNDNPKWTEELETVENLLKNPPVKFYGIGETGLDLYWSKDYLKQQQKALHFQIELSIAYDLPVIIHTREAFEEVIDVFRGYKSRGIKGIFHSFAGTLEQYRAIKNLGDFKFGIGGVVTFKNAKIADVVASMDMEDLVLETDSPYLTPVPFRGKRNESSYLPYIAEKIAALKNIPLETVAEISTKTAIQLFGLK